MKKVFFIAAVALCVFNILLSSCSKDEPEQPKPTVVLTEVGHDNSKTVAAGSDLHLEAEITAPGIISAIIVEIHQENGGDFEIEKSFTDGKYTGVKNVTFHEHIDIPADAPSGEYHLHLKVRDKDGQTDEASADLNVLPSTEEA